MIDAGDAMQWVYGEIGCGCSEDCMVVDLFLRRRLEVPVDARRQTLERKGSGFLRLTLV
jgi:hypothetical protein